MEYRLVTSFARDREEPLYRAISSFVDEEGDVSELLRTAHSLDYDIARVYRLASVATALGGWIAIRGAWKQTRLSTFERAVAGGVGAVFTGLGLIGACVSPSHVAMWFQRRPRRSMFAAAPVGLGLITGGEQSPLYRLGVVGVANAFGLRERRRETQLVGLIAWGVWTAQAQAVRSLRRRRGLSNPPRDLMRLLVTNLTAFVLSSRIAAPTTSIAYDARALLWQLIDFANERHDLDSYVAELAAKLVAAREALREAATARPREGVSVDELHDEVLASLCRLEERLGVLQLASTSVFDTQRFTADMRAMLRRRKSLSRPEVHMDATALEQLVRGRVEAFGELSRGASAPDIDIDPELTVTGLQRVALIGAFVTAVVANAMRHATGSVECVRVSVSEVDGNIDVAVSTDGSPGAQIPAWADLRTTGLANLRARILDFGGTVQEFRVIPPGIVLAGMVLPSCSEDDGGGLWSEDMRARVSAVIDDATRVASFRAFLTALRKPEHERVTASSFSWRGQLPTRLANASIPLVAEVLAGTGRLQRKGREIEAIPLLLAALLNYRAASTGCGLTTTWVSGFGSRYAHDSDTAVKRVRANCLVVANIAAMTLGAWRSGGRPSLDDVVSVALAPLLVGLFVIPAETRITLIDEAMRGRLVELESLHELADAFHFGHPAPTRIRRVADMLGDTPLAGRLRGDLAAIERSEHALVDEDFKPRTRIVAGEPLEHLGSFIKRRRLFEQSRVVRWIWPEDIDSAHSQTVGVADAVRVGQYLGRALGRRIWPARVKIKLSHDTMRHLPAEAVESAAFRRNAVAAMDLVGREMNQEMGRALDGFWNLRQVELDVSVHPWTGSIYCEMTAWASPISRWREIVEHLHRVIDRFSIVEGGPDPIDELERRLALIDASLDRRVFFRKTDPEYDEEKTEDIPSTRSTRMPISRGVIAIELHPQKYSKVNINLARMAATGS